MDSLTLKRRKIDAIDSRIVALLVQRMQVSKQIGQIKKREKMPVGDAGRERQVIERIGRLARRCGLSVDLVGKIFKLVIRESRRRQL